MSEWISIQERLPETHDIIDVMDYKDDIYTCYYHADNMGRMNWRLYQAPDKDLRFQIKNTGKFLHQGCQNLE